MLSNKDIKDVVNVLRVAELNRLYEELGILAEEKNMCSGRP